MPIATGSLFPTANRRLLGLLGVVFHSRVFDGIDIAEWTGTQRLNHPCRVSRTVIHHGEKNSAISNDDAADTSLFITVRRIGEQY